MLQCVLHERRDVVDAFPQRGHGDVDDAKAIEQVLAEVPRRHPFSEIAIGGGDHTHVDSARLCAACVAHDLNLAILEKPQQHRLHARAHLPDLVEEERAAVGLLQLAQPIPVSAGEAAAHVTEEFRLQEVLWETGAVDRDETPSAREATRRESRGRRRLSRRHSRP